MATQSIVPSENWDDDFEFSQNSSNNSSKPKGIRKLGPAISTPLEPRLSVASSHISEDWDAEDGTRQSPPKALVAGSSRRGAMGGISSRLDNWAEPGPSTPTKHAGTQAQAENWDDDFEDKAGSPPSRRHHAHRVSHHTFQHHNHATAHVLRTRHSYHTPPRPTPRTEPENWDDDFDDPMDPSSSTSPSKTDNENTPVMKRTRREAYVDSSDEEDDVDFGFSEDKEEDKTVTARSRTAPMPRGVSSHSHLSSLQSPPPVPALPLAFSPSPIEPFPRSPAVSVFSIPTTSGRNSIGHFNSTSHLVLSGASSLAIVSSSPPQRERRRLRKKSRPPHMDNNVFELIEEPRDSSSPPLPPSTPERASSPPMVSMIPSPLEATPGSGGSKTPLLSRIGSVKKWGVRRKRASTGPAEVMIHESGMSSGPIVQEDGTSRPPSSLERAQAQTPSGRDRSSNNAGPRTTWFFRPGGAHHGAGSPPPGHGELKHEKSLEHARLRPGVSLGRSDAGGQVPTTPSKCGKLTKRKASGILLEHTSSGELTGDGSSSASGVVGLGRPSLGPNRRPSSMQVPNGTTLIIGTGSNKFASVGTRHASYGSSVGRASSSRVFSAPTPTESVEDLPPIPTLPTQEGSRTFMGSVRKISLVGGKKHKKKKSSVDVVHIPSMSAVSLQGDTADGEDREQDSDGDTRMQTQSRTRTPDLLPPIELHPPSPPRTIDGAAISRSIPLSISDGMESMIPSTSAPASLPMTSIPSSPVASNKATPKSPGSPQSASLGRTAQVPVQPSSNASVPRRNSLGDLKIPARISQAQIGLKRDLGLVREFASSVDKLKELQSTYLRLLADVQTFLESAPPSRATSPNVFSLVRPRSRLRSYTSPPANTSSTSTSTFAEHKQVVATLHAITVKYKISWECAELLIELGGGAPPTSPPESGLSSGLPTVSGSVQAELDRRKNRERAITLSGEESKSPPALASGATTSPPTSGPLNAAWRASTGRHDLSQRQLVLLRDMLDSGELPSDDIPVEENVNRNWRWGDAMNSTVTLPSEESGSRQEEGVKKKRRGRLGLTGLRDMLRMLKRSHSEQAAVSPVPALPSTASLSTDSSHYSHHYSHSQLAVGGAQRPAKTSTGPESVRPPKEIPVNSPYSGPPLSHKSPRRPSLASIFRLGQRNKGTASSSAGESSQDSRSDVRSASRGSNMTGDDDWDRIEAAIDLDSAARALGIEGTATIKGRKGRMSPFLSEYPHGHAPESLLRPVTPRRGQEVVQVLRLEAEASPRSLRPRRSTRLSNVEEVEDGEREQRPRSETKAKNRVSLPRPRTSPNRPPSRGAMQAGNSWVGSLRSAPPQPLDDPHGLPEMKLSMTPENIKPLLENAKEVHVRCHECIRELRALVDVLAPVVSGSPASAS